MRWKLCISSCLITLFVPTLSVNSQVPSRQSPRDVATESNRRELDNLLLRKPILITEDNSARQAVLKEINEDFKALQVLNIKVMTEAIAEEPLDYKSISNDLSELKSKASRLRSNLALPKVETDKNAKPQSKIANAADLKMALLAFDKVIVSFSTNSLFQKTNTIDVELAKQASRDLEVIIKKSAELKKAAAKLGKK